jgi:hypothetical protein
MVRRMSPLIVMMGVVRCRQELECRPPVVLQQAAIEIRTFHHIRAQIQTWLRRNRDGEMIGHRIGMPGLTMASHSVMTTPVFEKGLIEIETERDGRGVEVHCGTMTETGGIGIVTLTETGTTEIATETEGMQVADRIHTVARDDEVLDKVLLLVMRALKRVVEEGTTLLSTITTCKPRRCNTSINSS